MEQSSIAVPDPATGASPLATSSSWQNIAETADNISVEGYLSANPIVLVLVGLIGSGKSTFAEALQIHVPHIRRCNQDELGDRRSVEALARQTLGQSLSVCIDRTNFDASQRATWIRIAGEYPGTQVWVIVFDTPYEVCVQRLQTRRDHPTIKRPEDALSILARFRAQYQSPLPYEGYTKLLNLGSSYQRPTYTREDVLNILERVLASPTIDPSTAPRSEPLRGRGYRGGFQRGKRGSSHGGRGFYDGMYRGRGTYRSDRPTDSSVDDFWRQTARSSGDGPDHGS